MRCIVDQAGGGLERQALYHDVHLLERTLRSFSQPAGGPPAEHPISPHLPWILPVLLQVRLVHFGCANAFAIEAGAQVAGRVQGEFL